MVVSFRQWVQKQRKIFSQGSQERSEELSVERCQESAASKRDSMGEEGQKYKVAYGAGIAQLVVLGLAATVSRVRYSSGDISGSNSIPPKLLRMRV